MQVITQSIHRLCFQPLYIEMVYQNNLMHFLNNLKLLQHFIQAKCNFHCSHITCGSGAEEFILFLGVLTIASSHFYSI